MSGIALRSKGDFLIRTFFLVGSWLLLLPLLWLLTSGSSIPVADHPYDISAFSQRSATEIGGFAAVRLDPERDYRPDYAISFDSLSVSNRSLGLLRTALQKSVRVEKLRYVEFSYENELKSLRTDANPLKGSLMHERSFLAGPKGRLIDIPDISKAAHLEVNDFAFKWHRDEQCQLSVQSRRAVLSADKPREIVLLGRVILDSPFRKVEANQVTWDIVSNRFHIDKLAFISTADGKRTENGIWLDNNLNIVDGYGVKGAVACLTGE